MNIRDEELNRADPHCKCNWYLRIEDSNLVCGARWYRSSKVEEYTCTIDNPHLRQDLVKTVQSLMTRDSLYAFLSVDADLTTMYDFVRTELPGLMARQSSSPVNASCIECHGTEEYVSPITGKGSPCSLECGS